VIGLVLGQLGLLAFTGIALGLPLALAFSRLVASQVFGVATTEPALYLATSGLLLAVALVAALVPVRRALQVDPVVALREGG
jgi:ABC-type antimicrobial peptide transport system permease subunit